MSEAEVRHCTFGMMHDLMACLAIYEGGAQQKEKKRDLSLDEIMRLT